MAGLLAIIVIQKACWSRSLKSRS